MCFKSTWVAIEKHISIEKVFHLHLPRVVVWRQSKSTVIETWSSFAFLLSYCQILNVETILIWMLEMSQSPDNVNVLKISI